MDSTEDTKTEDSLIGHYGICCPNCDAETFLQVCGTAQTMFDPDLPDDDQDYARYPAFSDIQEIDGDGEVEYTGYTHYDELPGLPCYDTLETIFNEQGQPQLRCSNCDTRWYEPLVTKT